uniref:Uncharacterized protein n=1 Tax=Lotus japonicus TaxID=34305 RepID=I3SEY3_LOTJA|nr:unknown [Lotus japonicus]
MVTQTVFPCHRADRSWFWTRKLNGCFRDPWNPKLHLPWVHFLNLHFFTVDLTGFLQLMSKRDEIDGSEHSSAGLMDYKSIYIGLPHNRSSYIGLLVSMDYRSGLFGALSSRSTRSSSRTRSTEDELAVAEETTVVASAAATREIRVGWATDMPFQKQGEEDLT